MGVIEDFGNIEEYPFTGIFWTMISDPENPDLPEDEVTLLDTKCDIQGALNNATGGFLQGQFDIFFPYDRSEGVNPKIVGSQFRGDFDGILVNGLVTSLIPSTLGGAVARVQDTTS